MAFSLNPRDTNLGFAQRTAKSASSSEAANNQDLLFRPRNITDRPTDPYATTYTRLHINHFKPRARPTEKAVRAASARAARGQPSAIAAVPTGGHWRQFVRGGTKGGGGCGSITLKGLQMRHAASQPHTRTYHYSSSGTGQSRHSVLANRTSTNAAGFVTSAAAASASLSGPITAAMIDQRATINRPIKKEAAPTRKQPKAAVPVFAKPIAPSFGVRTTEGVVGGHMKPARASAPPPVVPWQHPQPAAGQRAGDAPASNSVSGTQYQPQPSQSFSPSQTLSVASGVRASTAPLTPRTKYAQYVDAIDAKHAEVAKHSTYRTAANSTRQQKALPHAYALNSNIQLGSDRWVNGAWAVAPQANTNT